MAEKKTDATQALAEAQAKIEKLEAELKQYQDVAAKYEKLQKGLEVRDNLLWQRYEQEVTKIPESQRDLFKKDNFESPIDAFTALQSYLQVYEAVKQELSKEIQGKNPKENPINNPVKSTGTTEYKGNSRLEALKFLSKLTGNKEE